MGASRVGLHDLLIFPETTVSTVKQEHDRSGILGGYLQTLELKQYSDETSSTGCGNQELTRLKGGCKMCKILWEYLGTTKSGHVPSGQRRWAFQSGSRVSP